MKITIDAKHLPSKARTGKDLKDCEGFLSPNNGALYFRLGNGSNVIYIKDNVMGVASWDAIKYMPLPEKTFWLTEASFTIVEVK